MKRAVFFDRDNTLIRDPGYFHDADRIEFIEGAIEALGTLQAHDFELVVITNQSGIGRGIFSVEDADAVHTRITAILAERGIRMAGILYCPHRPDEDCECRKPKPYMIQKAADTHGIDLSQSFLVGNDTKDMQTGRNAGVKTVGVFLRDDVPGHLMDFHAANLTEAAEWVTKQAR